MALKPQDLLVVLKLWVGRDRAWTYPALASELGMSQSEVHGAVRRAAQSRLLPEPAIGRPIAANLREFLLKGVKYAFPAERGGLTRGIPTSVGAPPLLGLLADSGEPPPVWPDPKGNQRGLAFEPLYPSAPAAAARDPELYELLALVDALRDGGARATKQAEELLLAARVGK
jgi:hypothetical protein